MIFTECVLQLGTPGGHQLRINCCHKRRKIYVAHCKLDCFFLILISVDFNNYPNPFNENISIGSLTVHQM